jgi:hypothetical protein
VLGNTQRGEPMGSRCDGGSGMGMEKQRARDGFRNSCIPVRTRRGGRGGRGGRGRGGGRKRQETQSCGHTGRG